MKKRITVIIACVIVVATVLTLFTACKTNYVKVSALTLNEDAQPAAERTATKVNVGANSVYMWSTTGLIAFSRTAQSSATGYQETTYTVVDAATGSNIYSGYDEPFSLQSSSLQKIMQGLFTVRDEDTGLYTFYDKNGVVIADVDGTGLMVYPDLVNGMINSTHYVNGKIDLGTGKIIAEMADGSYELQDKKISITDEIPESSTEETENYRIYTDNGINYTVLEKETMSVVRRFTITDITGNYVSDMRDFMIGLLPGDKIVVQEMILLPVNTTKDYDLYSEDGYFKVNTYTYDLEKGKADKVKNFNYILSSVAYFKEAGVSVFNTMLIDDDKIACAMGLMAFDEDLNVALDIQEILPYTNNISVEGDYVIFSSDNEVVYYKGDQKVFETEKSVFDASDAYLASSDLFVSANGNELFNADGSYITSLADLNAESFVALGNAKKYVYFLKEEKNAADMTVTNLYRYERSAGEDFLVATQGDFTVYDELGIYVVEDPLQQGVYKVYDLDTGNQLVSGLGSMTVTEVVSFRNATLVNMRILAEDTSTETYYYMITK